MGLSLPYCMINGRILSASDASITINDLAIQRGYGIFDFFKMVDGKPLFLEDHLDRFMFSAKTMRLDADINLEMVKEQITILQQQNDMRESGIRLTLTGGNATDGYSLASPNLIITQTALELSRQLLPPIHLVTYPFQRQMAEVKTIDYLMAIWLQPILEQQAANDVLYSSDGVLRECPRANFFIINENGELQTTKEKVLLGVTRKKVLNLASTIMPVVERGITMYDLANAREAFITSTTKHIVPVGAIDKDRIGDGHPGKWTKILSDKLLNLIFSGH